jgi:hypothetical protein
LLRDVTIFERELLGVFTLERKSADSSLVAFENGFHPWWSRTRDVALKWRASAEMEFVSAPDGFSSEGGCCTTLSGVASALRGLGGDGYFGPTLADGRPRVGSAVEFEWTRAMSQAQLGDPKLVKSVVFPPEITVVGAWALSGFDALESVVFPAGCIDFADFACAHCTALKAISLPVGCKATGGWAFKGCSSLVNVLIPAGYSTISCECFQGCTSLTEVKFPNGLRLVGERAFFGSALKEVALPDGCEVGLYAFTSCAVLTKVVIGSGCTSISQGAFSICGRLATVTLPSSVQAICFEGFSFCTSLATIAIPQDCHLHNDAFANCSPQVTRF